MYYKNKTDKLIKVRKLEQEKQQSTQEKDASIDVSFIDEKKSPIAELTIQISPLRQLSSFSSNNPQIKPDSFSPNNITPNSDSEYEENSSSPASAPLLKKA